MDWQQHPMDAASASLRQLAEAFEAWENGFRAEPTKFMTADECAAAQVSDLSASRAAYFMELLKAVPGVEFYPNLLKDDPASRDAYYASICQWGRAESEGAPPSPVSDAGPKTAD